MVLIYLNLLYIAALLAYDNIKFMKGIDWNE